MAICDRTIVVACNYLVFFCVFVVSGRAAISPLRSNDISASDGHRHRDGGSETGIPQCLSRHFKCHDGECSEFKWACDGEPDCKDGSDESPEVCGGRNCTAAEFRCDNGLCLPVEFKCDKEQDCGDGSDEAEDVCRNVGRCAVGQFECGRNCVPEEWRCDGKADCPGKEDETGCEAVRCPESKFRCGNDVCIDKKFVCDGDEDCEDGRDERGCLQSTVDECKPNDLKCPTDRKCIPKTWFCDSYKDCSDGFDEKGCNYKDDDKFPGKRCAESEWLCEDGSQCLLKAWLCDGEMDCEDGSDEAAGLCRNLTCRADQFRCDNLQCVPGHKQCDGDHDCVDGSDEKDCGQAKPPCSDVEFDCGDGVCLPLSQVCDGKADCPGFEDEPKDKCHVDECRENNGGCNQECVDEPIGYRCSCRRGFALVDDRTCADVDECLDQGACSHTCFNTVGSFRCECDDGYFKVPTDPTFCKAMHGPGSLIFSKRQDIRRLTLDHRELTSIVDNSKAAGAMDYVFKTGTIFWMEASNHTIYKAPIDAGFHRTAVIDRGIDKSDGLAVDWVYDHIYWTDTGKNCIGVANFDGGMRKTLIQVGMDEPRSIAVNPLDGWLFWSDWGTAARIERAGTDGSHRSTIVSQSVIWPNGITLDLVRQRIFWVDAKLNLLSSANFDGTGRKTVLRSKEYLHLPHSLTVFEDTVYWTDWDKQTIFKADKFHGTDVEPVIAPATLVHDPMIVHVIHPYKQPQGINYCVVDEDRCSHLCFPAPRINDRSPRISCACPDGMRLEEDSTVCVPDSPSTRPPTVGHVPHDTVSVHETVVDIELEPEEPSGYITVVFTAVASTVFAVLAVLLCVVYRHHIHKNTVSMNFENLIYKKTTTTDENKISQRFGKTPSPPPAPVEMSDESRVPLNSVTHATDLV